MSTPAPIDSREDAGDEGDQLVELQSQPVNTRRRRRRGSIRNVVSRDSDAATDDNASDSGRTRRSARKANGGGGGGGDDEQVAGSRSRSRQSRSATPNSMATSDSEASAAAVETDQELTDFMDAIPSSPAQIYRNMLILEESLRNQYVTLRARRWKYTFFSGLLLLWTGYFYYGVFVWYSVYSYVHLFHKFCLMMGAVTIALYYFSGLYDKTIMYPRKFLSNTNKGLRQFNLKLVSTHASTSKAALTFAKRNFMVSFYKVWYRPPVPTAKTSKPGQGSQSHAGSSRFAGSQQSSKSNACKLPYYHYYVYHYKPPGGDVVKLVMTPKAFNTELREGWEVYRQEYWEKENDRRASRARGTLGCFCNYKSKL
ncbi:Spo7-like protein-domain-containing protein [Lipomyces japonicus]|uniref:Spo7-like protein-domain-containing protein n=1 Tax=Lipomyces japonicus TaxID=56871 RepID=UPI0034CEB7A1